MSPLVQQEYEQLSPEQRAVFHRLLAWGAASIGPAKAIISDATYFNALKMAKQYQPEVIETQPTPENEE